MLNVLGVFAKWPRPGLVKTRLGGSPEWGATVARAFLLDTLARVAELPCRRLLVFAPDEALADFVPLAGSNFACVSQGAGDLGERLNRFFAAHLTPGPARVVVIGTDSPTLPVEHLAEAFARLDEADVVLGPATDGGYYLIGCRRLVPIFSSIGWGGSTVLAQTVARIEAVGARLAVLPPWYDVDTPDDWAMLAGHVAALRHAGVDPQVPATEALLRRRP